MANRRVSVTVDSDVSPYVSGLTRAGIATKAFARELESADSRLANMVQTGAALAPALVPLGAAAVPAVAGLATQLGFAASAAGVAVVAFNGVGDALTAVNDYALDPSTENLAKMNEQLEKLGPAGRDFVMYLQSLRPELQAIQDAAQEGLFPGAQEGLEHLMTLLPQVEDIVSTIATAMGDLAAQGGADLAGPRWREFFDYLEHTARPMLLDMGRTAGNFFHGFSEMVVAFAPLSSSFSDGLLNMSRSFDVWASSLSDSAGFQEFVRYVRESGPQAADTLGALAEALLAMVKAAAPVGSAVLPVIELLAHALTNIAESPAGPALMTAAAAVGVLGRSLALLKTVGLRGDESIITRVLGTKALGDARSAAASLKTAQAELAQAALSARDAQFAMIPTADKRAALGKYAEAQRKVATAEAERTAALRQSVGAVARTTALLGGLALATTGVAESTGVANTAMFTLLGTMGGPLGAAAGFAAGSFKDMSAQADGLADALDRVDLSGGQSLQAYQAQLDGVIAQMSDLTHATSFWEGIGDTFGRGFGYFTGLAEDAAEKGAFLNAKIRDLQDGAGDLSDVLGLTAGEFSRAASSADEFRSSLESVDALLSRRASFRDYRAAIRDMTAALDEAPDHFRRNGKVYDELQGKLDGIAASALKTAEKLKGESRLNFLDRAREQFIDLAIAMDVPPKKARALADDLKLLGHTDAKPKVKVEGTETAKRKVKSVKDDLDDYNRADPTAHMFLEDIEARRKVRDARGYLDALDHYEANPRVALDAAQAFAEANRIQARINALYGKTIVVRTEHMDVRLNQALGGVVDYFANGSENHVAQIAPAGAMRIWAEPETGGEAYIPLTRKAVA